MHTTVRRALLALVCGAVGFDQTNAQPRPVEFCGASPPGGAEAPRQLTFGESAECVPVGQPIGFDRALKDRGPSVELVFRPRAARGLTPFHHERRDRLRRPLAWVARHSLRAGGIGTIVQ
jgi:hypothetical protein